MNIKKFSDQKVLLIVIICIGIFLRLINIISEQLWEDEAISIAMATSSNNKFWTIVIGDIHPPLYYLILRAWIYMFGNSVLSARLLSAIFSILTMPILYLIGKEIADDKFGLIVIFIYSISPFSIFFANEVRAYSLIHFLFTGMLFFALRSIKKPDNFKNYMLLGIIGALLIYTHYMGFIYFGTLILGIIILKRKEKVVFKNLIFSLLITLLSYIPWIPYAFQDLLGGAHGYAGGQLNLISLSYWGFNMFLGPVPSNVNDPYVLNLIFITFLINIPLLILSAISLLGFIFTYKNKKGSVFKELCYFIIILIVFLFGISIIAGFIFINSFTSKNLIGGLSLVYLLEAFGLYQLLFNEKSKILDKNKGILKIFEVFLSKRFINLIIIILLITNLSIYPIFRAYYLQKPDWDGCFKKLKEEYKKHDIIIMGYPGGPYSDVMEYYSDLNDFDLEDNFYELYYNEDDIEKFFEEMVEKNITRIWIITFWDNYRDPNDKTEEEFVDEYNFDNIDEFKFRLDIKLTLYEIS